jgi:hypothetical protein
MVKKLRRIAFLSILLQACCLAVAFAGTCSTIDCGHVKDVCFASLDLDPVTCGLYYGCHCNSTAHTESGPCDSEPCGAGCSSDACSYSAKLRVGAAEITTDFGPALSSATNLTVAVAVQRDKSVVYDWWNLGQGDRGWLPLNGFSSDTPAVALNGTYAFIISRRLDGSLFLNQGEVSGSFVGWRPMGFVAKTAPVATSSGNITAVAAIADDGSMRYSWWSLGGAASAWQTIATPTPGWSKPAIALVGNYMFVISRAPDGQLHVNQGQLGSTFVGWQRMDYVSSRTPTAAGSANTTIVVASDSQGRFAYTWWKLGSAGNGWTTLNGTIVTRGEPSVSLLGNYLFLAVTDSSGKIRINQGTLGGAFTGWQ